MVSDNERYIHKHENATEKKGKELGKKWMILHRAIQDIDTEEFRCPHATDPQQGVWVLGKSQLSHQPSTLTLPIAGTNCTDNVLVQLVLKSS